ncbi:syndecan-1 [Pleurodeles waltl]
MARTALAAAMLLFFTLAFANDTMNLPPDDQDGSGGDDEDMFSGSGYAPIPDVSNAEEATVPSSTSVLPTVVTENQPPIVPEREMTKEPETIPTTIAVETERPIVDPNEEMHKTHLSAEKNITEEHTAVFLEPTSMPAAHHDADNSTMSHAIFPEVPNIPHGATATAASTQAASSTEAVEPHKHHHHPHHHGHHHEKTTAAPVTEAAVPHMHDDHHPETTSSVAPDVQHGHVHHAHHPESGNATESDDAAPLPTQGSHPLEEDTALEQTTIHVPPSTTDSKPNIPVVAFDDNSEQDRKDAADIEGSGVDNDAADFFIEPSIEPAMPEESAPKIGTAVENDGVSETSKGLMEQKGVLAAVIAGGVAGLVLAICLVGFMLYRMKKKDEGSYCLEETKQTNGGYEKPIKQEEFYA